jgi:pyruvate,orthophosphate dikinase
MPDDDSDDPLAFSFDAEHHRSPEEILQLLGGKGSGLAVMTAMGLPVPPGFTLTTVACRRFGEDGWTADLDEAVRAGLAELEHVTRRRLGDPARPLLVSVRSGAEVSMPGMMDTVLDVGMTPEVAEGLARTSGDPEFAADTHRRSLLSYAALVFRVPPATLRAAEATRTVGELQTLLRDHGLVVPPDPVDQLIAAVQAVFRSWSSERADSYRSVEGIDPSLGTAATVQAMVFGNLGEGSGTGVAFTRDPSTGAPGLMGDFLVRAQGEDVVAGRRQTAPLAEMAHRWPEAWDELSRMATRLEREFADMVDIEFTVEEGRLWMLQARRGKRSAAATMRCAVEMAEDPDFPLDRAGAVRRCRHLLGALDPVDGPGTDDAHATVLTAGLAASPGRAAGVLCLDVDEAVTLGERGTPVILVRRETSPSDVQGMASSVGLVTTRGGLVSHAAVVARSWGIPAVVGAADLALVEGGIIGNGVEVAVGEEVTVDGDRGVLLRGSHVGGSESPPELEVLRRWAAELDRAGEPNQG